MGHDLRPEYSQLSLVKDRFPGVPVLALTATADRLTRIDIKEQLHIPDAKLFIKSLDRPNISLNVVRGLSGKQKLSRIVDFIEQHHEVGQIIPRVIYPNGEMQYVAKLLPTPLDVFGRRFLPKCWIKKRNSQYELRESGYNRPMNAPYLSGCFMLFRTEAVLQARLFDERYFMYPEDIDLTRTIHRDWLTLYLPTVTIIHHHAKESYHSLRYLWIHIANMCRYFNKWGWFRDKERDLFNYQVLKELNRQYN